MMTLDIMSRAFRLMCTAKAMTETFESNKQICKYVHATSRGHEAIQLAAAFQLKPGDYLSPYYRDDAMLLGLGFTPYTLMLQLLAKRDDIFSSGREYYCHPSYKGADKPTIIHQSSATGMQAIPATGIAQALQYLEGAAPSLYRKNPDGSRPLVICSLGDACLSEGEVSEAFQVAALKQLPILYLVQDNHWGISVSASESRTSNAAEFAEGFKGLRHLSIDGSNFSESFDTMQKVTEEIRKGGGPWVVHAKVPLLTHHTSGVRKEFYRSAQDLALHSQDDPLPKLKNRLIEAGVKLQEVAAIESDAWAVVSMEFSRAVAAEEPDAGQVQDYIFAPTPVIKEEGTRSPEGGEKIIMVDAALFAIREIMEEFPEALFYGQDVGRRLGGVFREAATLAERFGDHRVFNTGIQEAFIIGSTTGMASTGAKPIVEVQFGDYIFPGINQLVSEVAKSCYLSAGKFPVQTVIRVPVGAYGGGGPYHSASIETILLGIKGIKIAYPSNAADMKGLMKAAFLDPNPVVMLEHKGLYWSKVPGTEDAKCVEPSRDYILPLGKGAVVLNADMEKIEKGMSLCIITYGMGVYWARAASRNFQGQVEVIDLRSLHPLDEELVYSTVRVHGKCLVLCEEQQDNSFAEALAAKISRACFRFLDAPVEVMGSLNLPAVPLNVHLEKAMLPNSEKVERLIERMLAL